MIEIVDIDSDGDMWGNPVAAPKRRIIVAAERGAPALAIGERAVVRFTHSETGSVEARIVRSLGGAADRVVGVYRRSPEGGRIVPTDRRLRSEFRVADADAGGATDGEIVLAEIKTETQLGLPEARVTEKLGRSDDPRAFSLIAIHSHGIPTVFDAESVAIAERAQPVSLDAREDLRAIPLITIDGADARDFDDAVWAEPDPEQQGGWHALVAIADVAWYVQPGSALDRTAQERGNSVYFPDRVVPMLPEALSNELCSLKPNVDSACMAVHMWIDHEGNLTRHRFLRGLMRSAARLTYEEAQAAIEGHPSENARPIVERVLRPLYGVYAALDKARRKRGALDLDLPERRTVLGADGQIASIEPRARLDSHKLIEELMIAANVAAAETLERQHLPCMYRVHDAPDPAKLEALREFLRSLTIPGLTLAKGQVVRPRHFNEILHRAKGTPYETMLNSLVLRSQSQAVYSPTNLGHFGLGLGRYAHFTSPIRRYADLLVHRALIAGLAREKLSDDPFPALGEQISMTERRAAAAERSAADRYVAAFLARHVGATFAARVNGVTRAGLFVTLLETGADGLVPMRSLPGDFYDHDEKHHRLVGRRSRKTFALGDSVTVRLAEADTVTGSLRFDIPEEDAPKPMPQRNKVSKAEPRKRH